MRRVVLVLTRHEFVDERERLTTAGRAETADARRCERGAAQ